VVLPLRIEASVQFGGHSLNHAPRLTWLEALPESAPLRRYGTLSKSLPMAKAVMSMRSQGTPIGPVLVCVSVPNPENPKH
jgi:hypothetical protein